MSCADSLAMSRRLFGFAVSMDGMMLVMVWETSMTMSTSVDVSDGRRVTVSTSSVMSKKFSGSSAAREMVLLTVMSCS